MKVKIESSEWRHVYDLYVNSPVTFMHCYKIDIDEDFYNSFIQIRDEFFEKQKQLENLYLQAEYDEINKN